MKRFLFLISAFAALSLAAGCNREEADVSLRGDFINASFNVSLSGDIATKAISDGTVADELLFLAYDADGNHLEDMDQTVAVTDRKASVTARLIRGVQYTLVFWAQKKDQYAVSCLGTDPEVPYIIFSSEQLPKMMNSDAFDAFFAKVDVTKDANFEENITLTRPFAQINLAVDDEDYQNAVANGLDMANAQSAFTFQGGLNNRLRLLDGAIDKTQDYSGALTCTAATVPGDQITSGNGHYTRIGMLYVLADENASANLNLSFTVNAVRSGNVPMSITRDIANVPVKKNYRTNIVGKLFTVGGTITISIVPDYLGTEELPTTGNGGSTTYTVSVCPPDHGSVAVAGTVTSFQEGDPVTLTVTPDNNYELSTLFYNEEGVDNAVPISQNATGAYVFDMPANNVTVYASFKEKPAQASEVVVEKDHDYLAANKEGNLDNIISYTNSSDYGTTPVSELRVYKGKTLVVSAESG